MARGGGFGHRFHADPRWPAQRGGGPIGAGSFELSWKI